MSTLSSNQLFIAVVLDKSGPNKFHVAVWKAAQPLLWEKAVEIRVKGDDDRFHKAITFRTKSDYDEFTAWWNKYKILYGGELTSRLIPTPNAGEVISGVIVEHLLDANRYGEFRPRPAEEFVDEWAWIVETCSSRVWWTWSHWIFESPAEAVMFKLQIEQGQGTKLDEAFREEEVKYDFEEHQSGEFECDMDYSDLNNIDDLYRKIIDNASPAIKRFRRDDIW